MTPEQIESTMQFILTHQANAEVPVDEIRSIQKENAVQIADLHRQFADVGKEMDKRHEHLSSEIRALKDATQDLLDSDKNIRRRLDRLDQ